MVECVVCSALPYLVCLLILILMVCPSIVISIIRTTVMRMRARRLRVAKPVQKVLLLLGEAQLQAVAIQHAVDTTVASRTTRVCRAHAATSTSVTLRDALGHAVGAGSSRDRSGSGTSVVRHPAEAPPEPAARRPRRLSRRACSRVLPRCPNLAHLGHAPRKHDGI